MGRPELNRILQEYQVEEDVLVAYRPRVLGAIDIPLTPVQVMTRTEAVLLDELTARTGFLGLVSFKQIHDEAFRESRERYLGQAVPAAHLTEKEGTAWIFNDGHRDAYRHAHWNAMLVHEFGAEWTARFATAHEGLPSNSPEREAMDLYNNKVGREIAMANPDASPEQLADMIQQAVDQGKMLVIDKEGNLAWSDQVSIGQHGTAREVEQDRAAPDIQQHSSLVLPIHDSPHSPPYPHGTHALYASCVNCIDRMDLPPLTDHAKANLAGSLMNLAERNSMTQVDHAFFSKNNGVFPDGHFLIAIQGNKNDPAHSRAKMLTSDAMATPLLSSLAALTERQKTVHPYETQPEVDIETHQRASLRII